MHRFFLSPENFHTELVTIRESEIVHQLTRVLRARVDSEFVLLDGSGREFLVCVTEITKTQITARILSVHLNLAEPEIQITLFQGVPKNPARFEQVLQHGTEIGITKFVPLLTERTEVRGLKNRMRLEKIIREAAEQSGRGILPTLAEPVELSVLLKSPLTGKSLIGDSFGTPPLLRELLPTLKNSSHLNLFIGPEGGFSESEIALAVKNGITPFSLGKRILRTETAGVAVASALLFG